MLRDAKLTDVFPGVMAMYSAQDPALVPDGYTRTCEKCHVLKMESAFLTRLQISKSYLSRHN